MKIRFLSGPRAGQIDHAPLSQETDLLVKAGLIEVIPYKDFRDRLAETMPKPTTPLSTGWGVQHVTASERQPRNVIIVKTAPNGDVTFYDAPPKDCPPAIVARYRKELAVYEQIIQDKKHADKVRAERL